MGLELVDSERQVLAEVFRCDADHTVTLTVFDRSVPTSVVEQLVEQARADLAPFEDGQPLPSVFRTEDGDR